MLDLDPRNLAGERQHIGDLIRRKPDYLRSRQPTKPADLDGFRYRQLHARLLGWYQAELEVQWENRIQQGIDVDFYDNVQWDEETVEILRDRGQKPLTFNIVATTIDWIIGSERRARADYKVLPRRKEDGKQAELKTHALKYLADVNKLEFHRSRAFEDAVKAGIGWLEDQWQDDGGLEPVYSRHESWRNMIFDSTATEMDLNDGRYIFRPKWVDLDVAETWFPDRTAILRRSAVDAGELPLLDSEEYGDEAMDAIETQRALSQSGTRGDFMADRPRVRLIEGWYRVPARLPVVRGSQFGGEVLDLGSRGHYDAIEQGTATVSERVEMETRVAVMTEIGMLYEAASPYRHNRFPFTPIWGYRRDKTGLPYGLIRRLRDPQIDVNERAAKALHILSTNKTFMEEGAVDDIDQYNEEISRADAVVVYRAGKKIDYNVDRDLAPAHMAMMERSIQLIQSVGGVTDANLGRQTNATSGKAITALQDQGSLSTAALFDNLLFARTVQGEKQLSLIEQFFTDQKTFRIANQRGNPKYITVNTGLPEDDITRTKADFIISESQWRATLRQAASEQLMQMITELAPVAPQLALNLLDLAVEEMDLANRDEIVARIRQLSGMRDPDAEEPTPEEIARAKSQAEAEERAIRMQEAEIADKEASAAQKMASAETAGANARRLLAGMVGDNVAAQKAALEAALAMLTAPGAVPVADRLLSDSGYVSRTEQEDALAVDKQASELEALAAEGAAMQEQQAAAAMAEAEGAALGMIPAPQPPQQ